MWRARLAHFHSPSLRWLDEVPRADRIMVLAVRELDAEDRAREMIAMSRLLRVSR